MPIPTLNTDDEALGQPWPPVPLRLVSLFAELTCAELRYLLTLIQDRGEPYLPADA